MKFKIKSLRIGLVSLLGILGGCHSFYPLSSSPESPNTFYMNENIDITSIGRVTLLEMEDVHNDLSIATYMTDSLFLAIQKKQLVGIDIIRRDEPEWKIVHVRQNQAYTLDQLSVIHKTVHNNAILTGQITRFEPYPHLAIGLKLKMIDLRTSEMIWAFEQIWDSNDQTTKQKIRRYFERQQGVDADSIDEQLVARSSRQFIDFISHEVAETFIYIYSERK